MSKKKLLFSVTKSDCRWDYYRGSGKGGQKRNKTENCCRCTHLLSGAVGKSEEGRSKEKNRKAAFGRMARSQKFQDWVRIEASRRSGERAEIENRVERSMSPENIRSEVKDDKGRWVRNA
jgi:protein subunit release factor B